MVANTTVVNSTDSPSTPQLINISQQNILKLSSTNYVAWNFKIEAIVIGYDLFQYVDGSHPCPSPTVSATTGAAPNPAHSLWSRSDELAALGKPLDPEDLTELILEGLDDDYRQIIDMVDGRESSISFDELHKKLITRELTLQQRSSASSFSATVNVARHNNYKPQSFQSRFSQHASPASRAPSHAHPATPTSFYTPKSYLGKCQACRKPGHSASRCPEFSLVPASCGNARPSSPLPAPSSWQPQAHVATLASNIPPTWLLDSGAFHHVTASLDNMSLLSPYEGTDDIVIGDGSADGGDNSRRQS